MIKLVSTMIDNCDRSTPVHAITCTEVKKRRSTKAKLKGLETKQYTCMVLTHPLWVSIMEGERDTREEEKTYNGVRGTEVKRKYVCVCIRGLALTWSRFWRAGCCEADRCSRWQSALYVSWIAFAPVWSRENKSEQVFLILLNPSWHTVLLF